MINAFRKLTGHEDPMFNEIITNFVSVWPTGEITVRKKAFDALVKSGIDQTRMIITVLKGGGEIYVWEGPIIDKQGSYKFDFNEDVVTAFGAVTIKISLKDEIPFLEEPAAVCFTGKFKLEKQKDLNDLSPE